jgi:predicted thioesterase
MEVSSGRWLQSFVSNGAVTLGKNINIKHLKSAHKGEVVYVQSEVVEVFKKSVVMKIIAKTENNVIAEAVHERGFLPSFILDRLKGKY